MPDPVQVYHMCPYKPFFPDEVIGFAASKDIFDFSICEGTVDRDKEMIFELIFLGFANDIGILSRHGVEFDVSEFIGIYWIKHDLLDLYRPVFAIVVHSVTDSTFPRFVANDVFWQYQGIYLSAFLLFPIVA